MSAVEITDGRLLARIEISDRDVVSYFLETKEGARDEQFRLAVKLGVTALRTLGTTERVDYIERKFGDLQQALQAMLTTYFAETGRFGVFFGEKGELTTRLEAYFGQHGKLDEYLGQQGALQRKLDDLFGTDGEVPRILERHFGDDGVLLRRLYNPNEKKGPIYQIQESILNAIRDLGKDIGLKRAEEAFKPVAKGGQFEGLCASPLEDIARVYKDVVSDTRDVTGAVPDSKKGDFVVEIEGNAAHDLSSKLRTGQVLRSRISKITWARHW